jgi:8-oxo-dGTP pyrophosphatase MutT (NUDIX family)
MVTHKQPYCCANCGGYGHLHRHCNHPITSYGLICFRLVNNQIQYIMVQRKDSLSYIEFIRGKYVLNQKSYIMKLISNMTSEERTRLLTHDFVDLWKSLWQLDKNKMFQKEFTEAKLKFDILKAGYIVKNHISSTWFDLKYVMQHTESMLVEPEWGFPKGRRNINEADYACALREFREETNLSTKYCTMLNTQPYEEVFNGTNYVRYKHVYYLAFYNAHPSGHSVEPSYTCREIQNVKWMSYEDAQNKIRHINVERKELFKRVHSNIQKIIGSLVK